MTSSVTLATSGMPMYTMRASSSSEGKSGGARPGVRTPPPPPRRMVVSCREVVIFASPVT